MAPDHYLSIHVTLKLLNSYSFLDFVHLAEQKQEVIERIKKVMRNMIRYEMKYVKSYDILNDAAEELAVEANDEDEILANCDRFETVKSRNRKHTKYLKS